MKKPELLAPAGNQESFIAAIEAGADAIYLGGNMFGARSFANNFDNLQLEAAVDYAHKLGVKVYITTNTLIYENEIERFTKYISFLESIGVDAVIMQDIGMMDKIRKEFPNLEIHASTQMHIHNLEGVKFVEKMGLTRAVLARETDYKTIKEIKDNTNIELEIFVHGALCISYSGQCLMSSLIGNRSGNRGTCAGSCRQKYDVLNSNSEKVNIENYNLSTKDLNSLNDLEKLIETGADSFKIEGRMKSPEYVFLVVSLYRKAIDSYFEKGKIEVDKELLIDLKKTFNRKFTKGFLFETQNNDFINPERPNHIGIQIGKVIDYKNGFANVKLTDTLNINDGIRICGKNDVGFIVTTIFKNRNRITTANNDDIISLPCKEKVEKGDKIFKTLDFQTNKKINSILKKQTRKFGIDGIVNIKLGSEIKLHICDGSNNITVKSNLIAEKPVNMPTDVNRIKEQLLKTGNSNYFFKSLKIDCNEDFFISIKEINDLRRRAFDELDLIRIAKKEKINGKYFIDNLKDFNKEENINYKINSITQYEFIKNKSFKYLYLDSSLYNNIDDERKIISLFKVMSKFTEIKGNKLVSELGSVNYYSNILTDYSLNVVNSYSVALLHSLGASQVTLSLELEINQIEDIINAYINRYQKRPNLEVIVYGKEEIMTTKFNLLKFYNLKDKGYLLDRFNNKYLLLENNKLMSIYNYKPRKINKPENLYNLGVNNIRFDYVDE